jgi:Mrp family chromosome partitioning ATPase
MALTTLCSFLLHDLASTPSYSATLQVQIHLPPAISNTVDVNDTTTFFAQLLVSPDTLSLALPEAPKQLDLQLSDLETDVTASAVTDTNVVQLTAAPTSNGSTPPTSNDASTLVLDVYQSLVQNIALKRAPILQGLDQTLNAELQQTNTALASTTAQLQNLVAIHQEFSTQYRQLQSLYAEQQLRIKEINQSLLDIQQQELGRSDLLTLGSSTPTVTTVAGSVPIQSQRIALSPLVGLIMGSGGVLLAMRFSTTIPVRGSKREAILPAGSANFPRLRRIRKNPLEMLRLASPATTQLIWSLRHSTSDEQQPVKVVTITSPVGREGKSTLATSLAAGAAQGGLRTLLVDANPRKPVLHRWFQIDNTAGTLEAIRDFADHAARFTPLATSIANLEFLPIGQLDQKASQDTLDDPLRVDGLRSFIEAARRYKDLIIFDSSPLLNTASSLNLSALSDTVLLVVDAHKSKSIYLQEAEALLEAIQVPYTPILNRAGPEAGN